MLVARGNIENRQAIVRIGFQPFVPTSDAVQGFSSALSVPVHEYRALIDTGAQRTCLCRSVIAKERLRHHAKRPIQNVHGVELHYLFWVNVGFVCERLASLTDRIGETTYFALPEPIEIMDIADNHWFDAIIGMDLIAKGALQIDNDGNFALTIG